MPKRIDSTPQADGFRMPAEYEQHDGCWMLFPRRSDTWRLGAKPAQRVFAEVATAIARFEPVTVGVHAEQYAHARGLLPDHIRVLELSSNDAWMRDCGATFVINDAGDIRGVDWRFNAWGGVDKGMYPAWDLDEQVAQKMCELIGADSYKAPFVIEGGAIHVDGEGTLIVVAENVLHSNRNGDMSRGQMEEYLKVYLNVQQIIWIERGVYNDETDGHVDNLCCFIRPGVVALTWTDDKTDPQYEISQETFATLSQTTDAQGRQLEIHKIHQPTPMYITEEEARDIDFVDGARAREAGERLAGSYINFYIANEGIIVPIFDDIHDENALKKLGELFPEREIVGVYAREILLGGGNIHCITQQQPKPLG